ncbi:hypothetical protein LTR66_007543 [Elasticomyces elasticus]|nr:hypothetical protein LTR66_007543 [Elasticomyces elasticus]
MVSGALAPCDAQLLRLLNQLEGRASRPAKWAKALTLTPVKRLKRNLLRRAYMKFDATANGISLNWAGRVRMPDPPPTTELTYPMPCRCFPSSDDSLPSLRSYMNNESCQQHPPSTCEYHAPANPSSASAFFLESQHLTAPHATPAPPSQANFCSHQSKHSDKIPR